MNEFYTYAYLRENGTPYYIGRGKGVRALNGFHARGKPPKERILFLKTNLTFEESVRHEIYMIAILGRKDQNTGILRNLTSGGEGTLGRVFSPESIEKMKRSHTGKTLSVEHRAKVGRKVRKLSKETRRKMSEAKKKDHYLRGKHLSQEHAQRVGESFTGRKWFHKITDGTLTTCFKHEPPDETWQLGRKPS